MKWISSTALSMTTLVLAGMMATTKTGVQALEVGDEICLEGFVMDFFCINRGTLLDNPSVVTLEEPNRHSVHCLVDVGSCVRSPFEILIDPFGNRTTWSRGWRVTDDSRADLVSIARSVGTACSTCDGDGFLREGFRAVMVATILDLNADDTNVPPLIEISEAAHSTDDMADPCMEVFQMEDVIVTVKEMMENGNSAFDFDNISTTGGNLKQKHFIHGALMMISWGFLLPTGALFAKFFKHRPDALWYKIHQGVQVFGLLLAVIGWVVALRNFQVFADVGYNNYRHGIMGMTVMIAGLLQPINAVIRPHPPVDGEAKSTFRFVWEIVHKGLGWGVILLAVATIGLGTTILPDLDDQATFQRAYGIGCGVLLLTVIVVTNVDKFTYKQPEPEQEKAIKNTNNEME